MRLWVSTRLIGPVRVGASFRPLKGGRGAFGAMLTLLVVVIVLTAAVAFWQYVVPLVLLGIAAFCSAAAITGIRRRRRSGGK